MLVESGPERSWPRLEAGLRALGITPDALSAVLLTHIHLDHAGAAWRFCELGVPVHVHSFGVRHLVEPSRLVASATRIYGDDMDRLWGRIEPCPEHLVHGAEDGTSVSAAGLSFRAVETPGHATHHHAWSLEHEDAATCFTGDAAAMLLPDSDWISIPMPPPEFDLDLWHASLDRLEGGQWDRLCLTHGGERVGRESIARHLAALRKDLDTQVRTIRQLRESCPETSLTGIRDHLLPAYRDWLSTTAEAAGVPAEQFGRYVTPGLLGMNLMGVCRYLDQQRPLA